MNLKNLLGILICILLSVSIHSCGENEPTPSTSTDPEDSEPTPELPTLTQSDLIGTWKNIHPGTANFDYFAFDGKGNGLCVLLADQYRWEDCDLSSFISSSVYKEGLSVLNYFTYTINANVINISPKKVVTPFKIKISQTGSDLLKGNWDSYYISNERFDASKISDSPEWFLNEGPASVDLTEGLTGLYINDSDRLDKREVKRINNYTISIEHGASALKGYLSYSERLSYPRDVHIENANRFHQFNADGKLQISSSFYSKQGSSSSSAILAGTRWSGVVEGDTKIEIYFSSDGKMTEKYLDYNDSETTNYREEGNKLYFYVGTLAYNTFGDSASFEVNSSKTQLKIYNRLTTWTLKRNN